MKKTNIFLIFALIVSCILVSCSMEDPDKKPYLNLSVMSYTFSGSDNDTLKVYVDCSDDWDVASKEEWISVEKDGEYVNIYVADNMSGYERKGVVSVFSVEEEKAVAIEQLAYRFDGQFEDLPELGVYSAMSRNGRYICGMDAELKDEQSSIWSYKPTIIDTYTGERSYMSEIIDFDSVMAISDDGRTIIYRDVSGGLFLVKKDDIEVEMKLPEERYKSPAYSQMSADGSVIVGFCLDSPNQKYVPVKWVNGEGVILDSPTTTVWGYDYAPDVMARGCNSDGSIIYGSDWMDMGFLYWKDDVMYNVGADNADTQTGTVIGAESDNTASSPSGKYIGCFKGSSFGGKTPTVYNTETMEYVILDGEGEGFCFNVTDNGLAFIGTPSMGTSDGFVVNMENKEYKRLSDWMLENYGISISENRYVRSVSEDGKTFFGTQMIPAAPMPVFIPWYYRVTE